MAQIREELTLLDRFTSSFNNYIGLAQRGQRRSHSGPGSLRRDGRGHEPGSAAG